jgi:predicted Zn finger-like uncharacterized protein
MLNVKCPHCATAMKLREAPASGKVKCPKCGQVVAIAAAAKPSAVAAAPRPAAVPSGPTLDPDDEAFDFGKISFPSASGVTAVSRFPVAGQMSVYEGPIPGDPLALVAKEDSESPPGPGGHAAGPNGAPAKAQRKRNPMVLVGVLAGAGLLILGGVAAIALTSGGGEGSGGGDIDVVAAAQSTAPAGYQAHGIRGCVVLMPKGAGWDKLPSAIESVAVTSQESDSVYFLGAMDGGKLELDNEQMRKKAERQLGGEILGGNETERNGYKGIQGMLDGSIFLPRMQVEVFSVDERFVIIGCAPASMGADPSVPVNRQAEEAEQTIFYGSFKVGPKPSGWW